MFHFFRACGELLYLPRFNRFFSTQLLIDQGLIAEVPHELASHNSECRWRVLISEVPRALAISETELHQTSYREGDGIIEAFF